MTPTTYQVLWTESAEEDLRIIIEYIFAENPIAAKDSLQKLKNKADSLDAFPQKGWIVPELKVHGILQYRELIIPPLETYLPYLTRAGHCPLSDRFTAKY